MLTFDAGPPAGRTIRRHNELDAILDAVHARPGVWARLDDMADSSALSLARRLRRACDHVETEIRYHGRMATMWLRIAPTAAPTSTPRAIGFTAYTVAVA